MRKWPNTVHKKSDSKKIMKERVRQTEEARTKLRKRRMRKERMKETNSWLFRADRYFQIHKLNDADKVLVATISFEGPTLNWYRAQGTGGT